MRLHRLTMTAIGPFPGTHEIDFARLGASGLFLLEGPTGAGKSTIIDAVVFALYGQVASTASSNDRLHSDHPAAAGSVPSVELVFETSSGVFRVSRTPAHDRAKARGEGTTRQPASVRLWRLAGPEALGPGEPLSQRVREADEEIARAVGLSREQFVQTMVLPQGEFAAFLRSDAEERRKVLQRLFGTEVYERVQVQLDEMRRSARSEREAACATLTAATATFAGAAGLEAEERELLAKLAADDVEALPVALADVLAGLATSHTDAETAASASGEVSRRADEVLTSATERVTLVEALRALLQRQVRLVNAKPEVETARGRLNEAQRAEPLLDALRLAGDAERAVRESDELVAEYRRELPPELRPLGPVELAAARDGVLAAVGGLRAALDLEGSLPTLEDALDAAERELARCQEELAEVQREAAAAPAQEAALEAELAAARPVAAERRLRTTERDEARTRLDAATRRVAVLDRLRGAGESLRVAAGVAHAANEHVARLRRRRIAGIAAELAGALVEGEPCAVCGSPVHPRPALPSEEQVGAPQVQEAEEAFAEAQAALDAAEDELVSLRTEDAVLAEASRGHDVEQADALLATAGQAVVDSRRAEGCVADAESRLETLRAGARARLELVEERTTQREGLLLKVGLRRSVRVDAVTAVLDAAAGFPSVADRAEALAGTQELVEAVLRATTSRDERAIVAVERGRAAVEAVSAAGFADAEAVRAACLTEAEQLRLRGQVETHEAEAQAVSVGLDEPRFSGVDPAEVVEVAPLRAAARRAREALDTAVRACGTARARLDGAGVGARDVEAAAAARAAVMERTEPVIRVANLASATGVDNERRIDLATFVLRRRFEEVVAAANQRLTQVSSGRYLLERTDDRESGRARRGGLGLAVLDLVTETRRAPATLSGGETFYVALSLALGLADVVTMEAGGIELGTLFVDEGFGSLDPGTLDQVLQVLARLREGGRVVGVVSHVEEMKGRIAERIEVRRRDDGSSTLTVRA